MNPFFEVLADDRGTDIHNPLLGHLRQVGLVGEVHMDLRLRIGIFKNVLNTEAFVLRDVYVDDLIVL